MAVLLLVMAPLAGWGPDAAWNGYVGDRRCQDGTLATSIGWWQDRGACP